MKALVLLAFVMSCAHTPTIKDGIEAADHFIKAAVDLVELRQLIHDDKFAAEKQDLEQALSFARAAARQARAKQFSLAWKDALQAQGLISKMIKAFETDPNLTPIAGKAKAVYTNVLLGITELGVKI